MDDLKESERRKYEKVWSDRAYARQADGEPLVDLAFEIMGCKVGETLIDWGCGCGRPAAKFQAKGLTVVGFDIAKNSMDDNVRVPFLTRCLWDLPNDGVSSDYAFCTDVLEHIPPDHLREVMWNMRKRTRVAAFIQVCTVLDTSGPKMNPPEVLHLSVMSADAWKEKLKSIWDLVHHVPGVGGKARSVFLCIKK